MCVRSGHINNAPLKQLQLTYKIAIALYTPVQFNYFILFYLCIYCVMLLCYSDFCINLCELQLLHVLYVGSSLNDYRHELYVNSLGQKEKFLFVLRNLFVHGLTEQQIVRCN